MSKLTLAVFLLLAVALSPAVGSAQEPPPLLEQTILPAVASNDVSVLLGQVTMRPRPCVPESAPSLPGPVCVDATAPGTATPSFLVGRCEFGYPASSDEVRAEFVAAFPAGQRSSVYAVVRDSLPIAPQQRESGFTIIFAAGDDVRGGKADGNALYLDLSSRIIGLSLGCGSDTVADLVASHSLHPTFLQAPPEPIILPTTGSASSGRSKWGATLAILVFAIGGSTILVGSSRQRLR